MLGEMRRAISSSVPAGRKRRATSPKASAELKKGLLNEEEETGQSIERQGSFPRSEELEEHANLG